jgi:hypothetical protein
MREWPSIGAYIARKASRVPPFALWSSVRFVLEFAQALVLLPLWVLKHDPRRVVYVAHPLNAPTREAMDANRENAARWCALIAKTFKFGTIADWIVLSSQWDETTENRELGLALDLTLLGRCDELWLVGGRISAGMAIELEHARKIGLRIVDLTSLGYECPRELSPFDVGCVERLREAA